MNNKENILIYLSNWLGTSETFIANQIGACEKYYNPKIIAKNNKFSELKDHHSNLDVAYLKATSTSRFLIGVLNRKLNLSKNSYVLDNFSLDYIEQKCKQWNIKLIHAHYGYNGLNILPVVKKLRIPLITTFHGNDISSLLKKRAYVKSLQELFCDENTYFIGVSEYIKNKLIDFGANEERIIKHYIGTNLDKFKFRDASPVVSEPIRFLQISNFVEKKGHIYTVTAFSKFIKKFPNARLVLGGTGPMEDTIRSLCNRLGIKDKVEFLGRINPDDVNNKMQDADIFVHNSITGRDGSQEGIPTVIMEAMATGLPVLSTRHAGIPELVENGVEGFLSEEKNIDEYVNSFQKMIENKNYLNFRENAFKKVRKSFDLKKQNQVLQQIYSDLIY